MTGHAVRALYLAAGVTDLYLETGEAALHGRHAGPVGRHGRRQDLPHRRRSAPTTRTRPSATATSCRPTAATARRAPRSPRSCGTGGCCWPPARAASPICSSARSTTRFLVGLSRDGDGLRLRQPAAGPRGPPRPGRARRAAPAVVLGGLLPAERDAPAGQPRALPGHRRRHRHPATPVRARPDRERAPAGRGRSRSRSRPSIRGEGGSRVRVAQAPAEPWELRAAHPRLEPRCRLIVNGEAVEPWRRRPATRASGARGEPGDEVVLELDMSPRAGRRPTPGSTPSAAAWRSSAGPSSTASSRPTSRTGSASTTCASTPRCRCASHLAETIRCRAAWRCGQVRVHAPARDGFTAWPYYGASAASRAAGDRARRADGDSLRVLGQPNAGADAGLDPAAGVTCAERSSSAWLLPSLAAGCGSSGSSNGATTLTLWARSDESAFISGVVSAFNRSHPRVQIKLTIIPVNNFVQKFGIAVAGRLGPGPGLDRRRLHAAVRRIRRARRPHRPALISSATSTSSTARTSTTRPIGGRLYGLPFSGDASVLFYNTALFRAAGSQPQRSPADLGGRS